MAQTHHVIVIQAPPARVYAALLDPALIVQWRVPAGMRCEVHAFDAREGGTFRVSLTYDAPDAPGKSSAHTDTYHGWFERLVPHAYVVERLEFETDDPQMQGTMRICTTLTPDGSGTRLAAVHSGLPPGISPADNEAGWAQSLTALAALLTQDARDLSPLSPTDMPAPQCPTCQRPMQTGFLLEGDPGAMRTVTKWVEGEPEPSVWMGLKTGDRQVLPVTSYRCPSCGRLESYALPA